MERRIEFSIEHIDVMDCEADVLVLKYAQYFYGADLVIARRLESTGVSEELLKPVPGDHRYLPSKGALRAGHVLFVGVVGLRDFGYQQIRHFAADALGILASEAPATRYLAMTIHGPGYGLDEIEAATSEFAGYLDAITAGKFPGALEQITIIDRDGKRVQRLRTAFEEKLPPTTRLQNKAWAYSIAVPSSSTPPVSSEVAVKPKPHIFIAMPFKQEFNDTFYYGIQQPVRRAGFTCERVDEAAFTGEVLERIRDKIGTAALVIAELSEPNPNVYLEVGYAWGKGRPTLLLARDVQHLSFDVQGQRCLIYGSIMELESMLTKEMEKLKASGIIHE